jgi:S-adenosylmethionine:tRNA ribosyltransferase-isomerase
MLVLKRDTGEISHDGFKNLRRYLKPGDCLVLNDTRVLPARLYGVKTSTGASVELLLLNRRDITRWETLVRPGKKLRLGDVISFGGGELSAVIAEVLENGNRIVKFSFDGAFESILDRLGEMPLPPYITPKLADKERYQTVYSKEQGSAAAPTAGLHFTPEILDELRSGGVKTAFLTLHVGLGTFRPVKAAEIEEHQMHSELYSIGAECCSLINETKKSGGRIIAVGTTSCRTLESVSGDDGIVSPSSGQTDIFIYPGYRFKTVDGLITNFHLPESTLIMLVSAFSSREFVLNAYAEAIKERYRFYSFGDCMAIL